MLKQFELIETIAYKAIDKLGKVAINVAKAAVTLICLGASVSYTTGVKIGKVFYKNNAASRDAKAVANKSEPTINNIDGQTTSSEQISTEQGAVYTTTCAGSKDPVDSQVEEGIDIREKIINIVQSINVVKPYTNPNYIERFVSDGLKDKLSENYLAATTYRLPNNKRVRTKTHKRFKDFGVMKEHYPILMATGTLR